jgi:23S rRNA (pseudouridine1915-N3)-methyltransferase
MRQRQEAARDVSFLIGGAFGLADELRSTADERLAVAPWTLPHDLARLVLAEQLYRAGTILRGEPYHK